MHAWTSRWAGKGRGLTGFVVGVVATLTLVGGGVAIAAIPSTTTAKFNGCVNKDTGVLRVVNYQAGKRCKKSEKGISWAQGWTYKGLWRATTSYRPGDVVLDNGSSYVARTASLAKSPPSDASRWGLLASPGPQGATGAKGDSGPVTLQYVTGTGVPVPSQASATYVDVLCPATLHALSAGVSVTGTDADVATRESVPFDSPSDTDTVADDGWYFYIDNQSDSSVTATAYVVCSSATTVT